MSSRLVIVATLLGALVSFAGVRPSAAQPATPPVAVPRPGTPAMPQPRDAPRPGEEEPTGTSRMTGQVLAADTGAPIRRAQVRAFAGELRVNRVATTDDKGRYELKDLPKGRYSIVASKGGYVSLSYGQRRPFEAGRPLDLGDNETLERIEMRLPRGSVITGRIVDEFGEAVAGARVQAMRYQFFQGQRRLVPAGSSGGMAQSDDRGEYRLYGLPPGDYFVSAAMQGIGFGDSDDRSGYAATYYPGTIDPAAAQRVTTGIAQERGNVSFALSPMRTVKVSGTVVDSDGKPLSNGFVMLMQSTTGPAVSFMFMGGNNRIRSDGSFTLSGIAPGSYTLQARGPAGGAGDDAEMAVMPLTVGADDIVGVNLVASKGASIAGVVTMDKGSTGSLRPGMLQVSGEPERFEPGVPFRAARVDDAGAFRVAGLMGRRLFRVMAPPGWFLKQVLLNGNDITDTPIDFKGTDETTGLEIIVSDRLTNVSGTVTNAQGAPTRDYTVVVFPDDSEKWNFRSRFTRTARPDQDGTFQIRGLPPFERYLAVAVDTLEDGEASDPEFLERMRDRATKLSLAEGESHALALRLIEML